MISRKKLHISVIFRFCTHCSLLYMDMNEGPTGPKHVAYMKTFDVHGTVHRYCILLSTTNKMRR
jgi:hypothetical protein